MINFKCRLQKNQNKDCFIANTTFTIQFVWAIRNDGIPQIASSPLQPLLFNSYGRFAMTKSYFTPGITSAGLSSKPVLLDSVITSSRVYLRFNYFAGHDKLFQNFYQLQFGYKTSLKF